MEVRGATTTVTVSDLDRAVAFYTDILGFTVLYRADPHFAMLDLAGFHLGLHPAEGISGDARPRDLAIGLSVADIRTAVAALERRGIDFPDGIVDDDGAVLRAEFVDPDGTGLYLIQSDR